MTQPKFLIAALLFGSISLTSAEAQQAAPEDLHNGRPHVGVLLGYGDLTGDAKGGFNYGIDAGYQISHPWSIGLQVNTFKSAYDFGGATFENRRWAILPKVTYNFGGETPVIKSSYLGVKLGAVIDKTVQPAVDNSTTRFGVGPVIGFDEPVFDHFTAGVDLSYLFVTGPESNNDSFHALGALKYWW